MVALTTDSWSDRVVALADGSAADQVMALAGHHQNILAGLEDAQAVTIGGAWRQARKDLAKTMQTLWDRTFGVGVEPTPAQIVQFARAESLVQSLDQRLNTLGIQTQASQANGFAIGADHGFHHAQLELQPLILDLGGAGIVGRSTFGHLQDVGFDLGMQAAVNETRNLVDEVRVKLTSELVAGATQGEGIRKLVRRLEPLEGVGAKRAELISRWSVVKGYNASREHVYNEAAEVLPGLEKMWLVQRDERTCPHCLAHHGEHVPAGDEFDKTRSFANTPQKVYGDVLEYPPLHPRCRCTIVTWLERWRGFASKTPEDYQAEAQELAQGAGFAPKTFPPPKKAVGALRSSRAGREVIRAKHIAQIPQSVRDAAVARFRSCWVGGK